MGQEQSSLVDEDTPPQTLKARSIDAVADHIRSGRAKKIVVMTGAGISTSAGIPDFRSPDTGLYANLARLSLPYAEAVFDISYFRQNPLPFYTLAHELYPGKYRPTPAHAFATLLHRKNLLLKLFTQNIDCLERTAGVPDEKIIEAHGSFARQRCIECRTGLADDVMRSAIEARQVPHCSRAPACNGLVKPDIVFFGEPLPPTFFQARHLATEADLVIVMGTSLSVQPFASLPAMAADGVPRVLINKERVGGLGGRADDVLLLGECDDGVRRLADALGWREELETLWREVADVKGKWEGDSSSAAGTTNGGSKDELLEDEIRKLTAELDHSLQVSEEHNTRVRSDLERENNARLPFAESKSEQQRQTPTTNTTTAAAIKKSTAGGMRPNEEIRGSNNGDSNTNTAEDLLSSTKIINGEQRQSAASTTTQDSNAI